MESPRTLVGPGALLAAIPGLLGFVPRDSVVAVSVRVHGEIGVILRVDRGECVEGERAARLARAVANHLARDRAEAAVLVSYTDDDVRLACPALDALRPVVADAIRSGSRPVDIETWAVVDGRYFSPGCARESCCPVPGRPLPAPGERELPAARFRPESHDERGSKPESAFDVDERGRRRASRAAERWWARRETEIPEWRRRSFALWRAALAAAKRGDLPDAPRAGRLVASLRDRRVRDAVLLSLLPGTRAVADGVLDGSGDGEVADALRVLLEPGEGRRPGKGVACAWDLLGWTAAHARGDRRAPALTLCALLAWWEGDDAAARALLRRAQASEPGYRLAALLECTVAAGLVPGWRRAA